MPAVSALAKKTFHPFSCLKPSLPTLDLSPTSSIPHSVLQPLPTSPPHELTPHQPLSLSVASPCLLEATHNSHVAREQDKFSKIQQQDAAPITKSPQAQGPCDSINDNNFIPSCSSFLLNIDDADNLNISSLECDAERTTCGNSLSPRWLHHFSDPGDAYDPGGEFFNGNIKDTSTRNDGDSYVEYDPSSFGGSNRTRDPCDTGLGNDGNNSHGGSLFPHLFCPRDDDGDAEHTSMIISSTPAATAALALSMNTIATTSSSKHATIFVQ
jgi:hypothetical protein